MLGETMRQRKLLAAALATVLPFALAACGGSSEEGGADTVIKIGALHPLSGANAADGQQMANGAKLAVEDINANGGIKSLGGAKLELASADSQGKPEVGQSEAQRLIQEGAVGIVGTYQSAVSANVATVAERNRVPFVIDISTADSILQQGYQYTFRVQPSATVLGTNGTKFLGEVSKNAGKPATSAVVLHEQGPFGVGVRDAIEAEAPNQGIKILKTISYDAASVSDLTTQMTEVKSLKPDVLIVSGYYRDGVLAAKAFATVKPEVQSVFGIANGAFDLPSFPGDANGAGENFFDANYHYDVTNADTKDVVDRYTEKYGEQPRTGAILSYDSVRVLADALERSGSTNPQKIRDAITETDLPARVAQDGNIQFDEKGENKNATPILMQVQKDEIVQVWPTEFAQAEPIYGMQ